MTAWPSAWSTRRVGVYTASELQIEIYPAGETSVGKVPIIFCHGFSLLAQPAAVIGGAPYWERFGRIAELTGCPVIAADLGGNGWANAASRTLFGTLRTWAGANIGTRTDKFGAIGESMGSILAANMAWRSPAECVALWLRAPIVAVQAFYDANLVANPGLTASMDAAYTNHAGLVAAYPTIDPANATNRAILASLGPRTRVDYTIDDQFIVPEIPAAYVAQTGADGHSGPGDHDANLFTPRLPVAEWFRAMVRANA